MNSKKILTFLSLQDHQRVTTQSVAKALSSVISTIDSHKNVLVLGEEGSGKSFLSCLIRKEKFQESPYRMPMLLLNNPFFFLSENDYVASHKEAITMAQNSIFLVIPDMIYYLENLGKQGQEEMWKMLSKNEGKKIIAFSRYLPFFLQKKKKEELEKIFNIIRIEPMTDEEAYSFLIENAKKEGFEEAYRKISLEKKLYQTVVKIIGGNPRKLLIFLDLVNNGHSVSDALLVLVDRLSKDYIFKLHSLSPLKQKIISTMGKECKALTAKEITERLGINPEKVQSTISQIKKLKELGIIEKSGGRGTFRFYYLKDALFQAYFEISEGKSDFFSFFDNQNDNPIRKKFERVSQDRDAQFSLTKGEKILYETFFLETKI